MYILVVCAGETDKDVFHQRGFKNVVISNLDNRMKGGEFTPYEWSFQDAEKLTYKDNSFDFCIVHEGLHHCHSPHRALLEMYRVAKKGIVLFEPYDNIFTRAGVRLKLGQDYEHAAVFYNDCIYGGLRNSSIPNFVYRWTEAEIIKTINSFSPIGKHRFQFIHKMRFPWVQLKGRKNKLYFFIALLSLPILRVFNLIFPKQSNNFAAVVLKPNMPSDLHPWLLWKDNAIELNHSWVKTRFKELN